MIEDPIAGDEGPAVYIPRTLVYQDKNSETQTASEASLATFPLPIVVLGDPGMGKTELLVNCARHAGFKYVTARKFLRRPAAQLKGDAAEVWVIDAIDEVAAARGDEPIQLVLEKLAELDGPPFILSCRGVDWRSAITKHDIKEDYGVTPLELELQPLSRSEARTLLVADLGDAAAGNIVEALEERGLEGLYGNPLTLSLISRLTRRHGKLPETRAELYGRACHLLRTEENAKHSERALDALTETEALDAAGAAFAALILTGCEAVSLETPHRVAEGDLRVAEIAALPDAKVVREVLRSRLFRREGKGDRMRPLHRTIAEYLGARWLAARFDTASQRRLFGLMMFNGGVPASLRGLHAWLAHFNHEIALKVIEQDPFGVLRYGDPDGLTIPEGAAMLQGLKELSFNEPYFRGRDWTRYAARGLAQPALAEQVKALVLDSETPHQLRSVLLDALKGSEAAVLLKGDLYDVVMNDGKGALGHDERHAATEILIHLNSPEFDWPKVINTLSQRSSSASRRLAVEIINSVGPARFTPATIVGAVLGYTGRLPSLARTVAQVDGVGPLYFLARAIPIEQTADVLDEYERANPKSVPAEFNVRFALNDFISTVLTRRLEGADPEPLELLRWLRIDANYHMNSGEKRRLIREWLHTHPEARRAVQAHVLFEEVDRSGAWGRAWGLAQVDPSLSLGVDDVLALLDSPHFESMRKPKVRAMWQDLLQLAVRDRVLPQAVATKARIQAEGQPKLLEFIDVLCTPSTPDWEVQQRRRDEAAARKSEALWTKQRTDFGANEAEIRLGGLGGVVPMSHAYIGAYWDLPESSNPRERIRLWLGDDLLASALEGFEAVLHRSDLPTSAEIAKGYAAERTFNVMTPILVGIAERVVTQKGLRGIPTDVLISARLGIEWQSLGDGDENELVQNSLDRWLDAQPEAYATFARHLVEPQLRKPRVSGHISGLYQLTRRAEAAPVITPLASTWLAKFPKMPASAESELVDHLLRFKAWDAARAAAAHRREQGYRDEQQRLLWQAVAFMVDFDAQRLELDAAAADRNLLWHIRNRGGLGSSEPGNGGGLISRAAWLVSSFRKLFPMVGRQSGPYSGDENDFNAADFLAHAINTIASNLSEEAIVALAALRDEPNDTYSELIRNAVSAQARARREEAFRPACMADLVAITSSGQPHTHEDLRAVILDHFDRLQAQARADDFNVVDRFYDAGNPLDEDRARDVVGALMREALLKYGIQFIPERHMFKDKRADLAAQLGSLLLPIEAKGQWNDALWSAPIGQLDALYTTDWRAAGVGIYLVFWFGSSVPASRRLRGPPRPGKAPTSPEALAEQLVASIPEHRRNDLAVVVLDVSRTNTFTERTT